MASSAAAGCSGADGATTTATGGIEVTAVSEVTVGSGAMVVTEAETVAAAETAEFKAR
jgi:hypothetical protein